MGYRIGLQRPPRKEFRFSCKYSEKSLEVFEQRSNLNGLMF